MLPAKKNVKKYMILNPYLKDVVKIIRLLIREKPNHIYFVKIWHARC